MIRILPDMAKAKAHWERRTSDIPDYLMVPMSDRSVVKYVPDIRQPRYVKAMNENMRKLQEMAGGGYSSRTDEY